MPTAERYAIDCSTEINADSIEENEQRRMLAEKLSRNARSLASRSGEPLRNAVTRCTDRKWGRIRGDIDQGGVTV
jgi:hypothetical protein